MEMVNTQQRGLERMINFLMDEMDMVSGISLGGPRFPEPPPSVLQHQPTNITNHISIDRSIVGAINTGTIRNLNQSMENVKNNVNDNYAKVIKLVVEEIIKLQVMNKQQQEEFLEKITFLTEQLATAKPNRKVSMIKDSLDWISRILAAHEVSKKIWLLAHSLFENLLK